MVATLMMSAKFATLGLLKVKTYWKNCYEVIISPNDVTREFLSRDSDWIVNLVVSPKFSKSSIYMREVIIICLK